MTAKDKITKAKVKLVLDQPFFATLALGLTYVEDPSIQTMATDGKQILYNPVFVDALTVEEVIGVICHECLHCGLLHHTRRQGRNPEKWNIAADYVINPIILDGRMKLPEGHLYDAQYAGKSAEEVYRLLPDPPQQPQGGGGGGSGNGTPDPGRCGAVIDAKAHTKAEVEQIEAEMKQRLTTAAMAAKQAGKLPAGMERLIDEILEPVIPWKEVLQRFLTQIVHADYSWTKPNKRYMHAGLYLPSMESLETGDFILIVDTSGSIGVRELNQFAAEMKDIAATFKTGFKIIWVDHALAGVQDVELDEDLVLDPKGGGGTSFVPGFQYIDEHDLSPSCVVYFTDGWCSDFAPEPHYPTLWAVMDNKSFGAPYGETLHMHSNAEF